MTFRTVLMMVRPPGLPVIMKTLPSLAIIVGDMYIDVMAGKNAGIATCAVTYGIGKVEDIIKAGPDFMIDDIKELKKIIN